MSDSSENRRPMRGRAMRGVVVLLVLAAGGLTGGCVVSETKPQLHVEATQATRTIPQEELLDVAVQVFDAGVPPDLLADEEALAKKRIYPDLRKAEARYIPVLLRNTLESSAQWGAVRVAPDTVQFVDVIVSGKIIESSGKVLDIEVTAKDAAGRTWIDQKRYAGEADLGSYKTDAAMKARDPFQNLYSAIANDLVAARDKLSSTEKRDVRRIAQLRFARDLAPEAMAGYLSNPGEGAGKNDKDKNLLRVARLPAEQDPLAARVNRVRERDAAVIDTLDGYYVGFSDQMKQSYGEFRRTSYEEIDKEDRARSSARTRTILGAAAVAASIFVPGNCNSNTSCNVQSAARYAGTAGGIASIISGFKKYSDARTHAQSFKELATTFQTEVATQVIDVEGRSLKLTGTAEEQYREWRTLLKDFYEQEAVPAPAAAALPQPVH